MQLTLPGGPVRVQVLQVLAQELQLGGLQVQQGREPELEPELELELGQLVPLVRLQGSSQQVQEQRRRPCQ